MNSRVSYVALVLLALSLSGCLTSASRLTQIHLKMPKAQVQAVLGTPTSARGSIQNKYGETIEVWEYILDRGNAPDGIYWLFFLDDTLVRWGQAGDWEKERAQIYEIRFR